ncbi:MAG TPA: hypothetical protein VNO24_11350 [Blastocatellia bacterium]|nr:hypothetical protein [Blastocatellia bacterium]
MAASVLTSRPRALAIILTFMSVGRGEYWFGDRSGLHRVNDGHTDTYQIPDRKRFGNRLAQRRFIT